MYRLKTGVAKKQDDFVLPAVAFARLVKVRQQAVCQTSTENRLKKQGLLSLGHFGCFVCNQTLPKQQATLGLLQFNGVHLKNLRDANADFQK